MTRTRLRRKFAHKRSGRILTDPELGRRVIEAGQHIDRTRRELARRVLPAPPLRNEAPERREGRDRTTQPRGQPS